MTEEHPRTGAARDVPPPRPVRAPAGAPEPEDTSPLGRAARAVADAVSGLLGSAPDGSGPDGSAPEGTGPASRSAAAGLREVLVAIGGAVGAWRERRESAARGRDGQGEEWSPGAFLGDLLAAAGPRLPIRDAWGLRQAYPGASDDEIADALVARAARLTAGIGAATGGLSAAHWLAAPSLWALPLELGAETVLTSAVEVVLIGELHELYGRRAPGDARERAGVYLSSWSAQRAVDGEPAPGLVSVLTGAGVRALRRRLARRWARSIPVAAPFLLGAALGGRANRRATEALAGRVLTDLRAGGGRRG